MTLYETIYQRRQIRKFSETRLDQQTLNLIREFLEQTECLSGQQGRFEIVPADRVNGNQGAPYYILSYCESNAAAYANVGYMLQKADLYIQSLGLGSGWFMSAKPKDGSTDFCIALAFGKTDIPLRKSISEFKRCAVTEISSQKNAVAEAVRLAPSSLNSQPWKLRFEQGKLTIEDAGHGIKRVILKNKLNKIDVGIAARHAVLALEQDGKTIVGAVPKETNKKFEIEISYT